MDTPIFISYSRKDIDIAKDLAKLIEQEVGVKPWFDINGIESGDQFENVIIDAIENSKIIILLLSDNSSKSAYVQKEVKYATKIGCKLCPIVLDKKCMTRGWFAFNFSNIDTTNYHNDTQMQKLFANLRTWLGISPQEPINKRTYKKTTFASTCIIAIIVIAIFVGASLFINDYLHSRHLNNDMTYVQMVEKNAKIATTINTSIQEELDLVLLNRMSELRIPQGFGIVMDVETGAILALSDWEKKEGTYKKSHEALIDAEWNAGSVFSTFSFMALCENDSSIPYMEIDTGNYEDNRSEFVYKNEHIRDDHPVGTVSLSEALVQDSHIGISKVVLAMYENNPQQFIDDLKKIGLWSDLKLEKDFDKFSLSVERRTTDEKWKDTSLPFLSFGYEANMTPLSILSLYNAIANGGKMMRPYFIERATINGSVICERVPEILIDRICSEKTLLATRKMLEDCVLRGTAAGSQWLQGAKSEVVKIAGKSGTAQLYNKTTNTYSGAGHFVSFVGYFPADHPKYSCMFGLLAVPGGNFGRPGGGYMAGPMMKQIAESIYLQKIQ